MNEFEFDSYKKLLLVSIAGLIGVIVWRCFKACSSENEGAYECESRILPKEKKFESEVYRSKISDTLISRFNPAISTLYENFMVTVEKYGENPFIGYRDNNGPYKWITYKEVYRNSLNIGSFLVGCIGLKPGDMVGICSVNRPEWIIIEQACNAYSLICVPLYDTFGEDSLEHILNQTEIKIVFCSKVKSELIQKISPNCKFLKTLVQFEDFGVDQNEQAKIDQYSLSNSYKIGENSFIEPIPPSPEDIATICYTSGTTGMPKGVVLTHGNLIANAAGCLFSGVISLRKDDVHLSYLPLAHVFERMVFFLIIHAGARAGFFRGSIKEHLFSDIQELRPTIFPSVPKLFNRIYDKIHHEIDRYPAWKRKLFEIAFNSKRRRLAQGILRHFLWDMITLNRIRHLLGGRVRMMVTASAAISPEVIEFLKICFSCDVYEAYGQTEASAAVTLTTDNNYPNGNVGPPLPCCEIKLVDVPELNYHSYDIPHPRGEVCVRGPNVFQGYFKLPHETDKTIDPDGWLHTGDIGEFLENATLRIVDRKNSIFKLAQGEYAAPERIENRISRSKYVSQCFVHGDRLRSELVCVVVPDEDAIRHWASLNNVKYADLEILCMNEDLQKEVLIDITITARESGLKGFEIPKAIFLEANAFTPESGIVTPTLKLKRETAKKYYANEIEEMYSRLPVY